MDHIDVERNSPHGKIRGWIPDQQFSTREQSVSKLRRTDQRWNSMQDLWKVITQCSLDRLHQRNGRLDKMADQTTPTPNDMKTFHSVQKQYRHGRQSHENAEHAAFSRTDKNQDSRKSAKNSNNLKSTQTRANSQNGASRIYGWVKDLNGSWSRLHSRVLVDLSVNGAGVVKVNEASKTCWAIGLGKCLLWNH